MTAVRSELETDGGGFTVLQSLSHRSASGTVGTEP